MPTVSLHDSRTSVYEDGKEFGEAGRYERIDARLAFAVDPEAPENQRIVDLRRAPRQPDGTVVWTSDVVILAPEDRARSRGTVLVEAVNRGRPLVPYVFNRATHDGASYATIPAGDGFLQREGFMVVHLGWQWDVAEPGLFGLDAPLAKDADGQDLEGQICVEIRPSLRTRSRLLANRVHRPSPVADLEDPAALLTVRDSEDGPVSVIPRNLWRFAQETGSGDVPSREHVLLESGFEPGRIYHVIYRTRGAPVVGVGLLSFREIAGFLRGDTADNPIRGQVRTVLGFGMSQSGRLLRHFLHLGLNRTEMGTCAYDGLMPYVAGGRRGEFNHRFAQPSVQLTPSFGHAFPFADADVTDPFGQGSGGIYDAQREAGMFPKVMQLDTSAEYWRGDGSLVDVDPSGERDLPGSGDVRHYLWAGTQHFPGAVPQVDYNPQDAGRGRYPFSVVDPNVLNRGALLNLESWVLGHSEPPESCHPRLSDGTAVTRAEVLSALRARAGLVMPSAEFLPVVRTVDLGPEADSGVARHPIIEGEVYPCWVSAVDSDGNETGGVRLPDLTVPLGTHTGFNSRHPDIAAPEQLIAMQGFSRFFARTLAERDPGDTRRPIEERYSSREGFLARVRSAANELARSGWIIVDDIEALVADAAVRWDYVMAGAPLDDSPWLEAVRANPQGLVR
jgi:hypothetical protein